MNIEIANRLVQLRKQNNLSQEELAARIGISRQAVSKWERAEASPDTDNLILLARLYNVSLDDLLRTEDSSEELIQEEAAGADASAETPTGGQAPAEGETVPDSGKDNKHVSIGWSGIHVVDGEEQVHVGWRGIHVDDGKDHVHIGGGRVCVEEDGIVITDEEWKKNRWLRFPFPVLAALVFFALGFGGGWWHPGWLVFLTVPLYYSLADCVTHRRNWGGLVVTALCLGGFFLLGIWKNLWHPGWLFLVPIPLYYILYDCVRTHKPIMRAIYPILAALVFFALGFGGGWWHPGWLVFLTIPLYYSLADVVSGRKSLRHFAYPVLATLAFFLLGFLGNWWSWCWLVFLTIPLYYALFPEDRVKVNHMENGGETADQIDEESDLQE